MKTFIDNKRIWKSILGLTGSQHKDFKTEGIWAEFWRDGRMEIVFVGRPESRAVWEINACLRTAIVAWKRNSGCGLKMKTASVYVFLTCGIKQSSESKMTKHTYTSDWMITDRECCTACTCPYSVLHPWLLSCLCFSRSSLMTAWISVFVSWKTWKQRLLICWRTTGMKQSDAGPASQGKALWMDTAVLCWLSMLDVSFMVFLDVFCVEWPH